MPAYVRARCSNYILIVKEHTYQLQGADHQQRASSVTLSHLGGLRTWLGATEAPGE